MVDDFAPLRQLVRSILGENPELQIVRDATDGIEAVQLALELTPDLIVMDIGLPKQNGIEAARQIRKLVPNSKMLSLSQESSDEVVQEAMSAGASGYVVKALAARDLLNAVEAALVGKKFVSSI